VSRTTILQRTQFTSFQRQFTAKANKNCKKRTEKKTLKTEAHKTQHATVVLLPLTTLSRERGRLSLQLLLRPHEWNDLYKLHHNFVRSGWFGIAVMASVISTKLSYIEPS